ncbi:MAG: D-alanyl-D-alanine dipeptidase [Paracoccaceae bacterium]|nr:D-alanyl-D-alanine dipeptidase [Paracoccaceae bacterium]
MTGPARSGSLLPLVTLDHPAIEIDLVYATDRNFTGQRLYADNRARLVPEAARALKCVAERLADQGLRLVVLDAYRPVSVQRRLWTVRPDPEFVADPAVGSDHSRGVAVDVTLSDGQTQLDMGTAFDAAVPQSHHDRSDISAEAQANRAILRSAMRAGGFDENPFEWWHYALAGARGFPLLDL